MKDNVTETLIVNKVGSREGKQKYFLEKERK